MIEHIRTRLKILLVLFFAVMLGGIVGFMAVEGRSLIDAAYFVIVSMATVGYGDIHPVTEAGKVFTIILIVLGVGTFLGVIANITEIMLARREVESRMEKLNMVIGVFFSEVGLGLMSRCADYDPQFDAIRLELLVTAMWSEGDFQKAARDAEGHKYAAALERVNFDDLKDYLLERRAFMVRLLENPVLMEHQTFTDLLRAVFHLAEELSYRADTACLPPSDLDHLAHDIKRVYHLIVGEWLSYMKHLKKNYPFLFSLAMRTNPFDRKACAVISLQ
jgi:voltage-gated potassium channel